ncbi:MAG: hypothetical protein LKE33_00490 [Acidaminococcus sp.]|jgi:hypothetical protein|nr:hypothetical protein [Acidaminococcus sp.]MCI2100424.1 hypothetical protein [Acidaminococcus sp.]MCI2114745.1 hypothetical protein [Acidaminococcus sp.]MCI2116777.1 hypothetical protein [Acidaminococcus sp.]
MEDVVIKILPDFIGWKLHTPKEYLLFFLVLATGIAVFFWKWKKMKQARTPEKALERVKEAIRKGSGKKAWYYLPRDGFPQGIDLIARVEGTLFLFKIYHKGYRVYGSSQESTWRIADNASSLIAENPLRILEKAETQCRERLQQKGISSVSIKTLAVFADNYAEPAFFTDEESKKHLASTSTLRKNLPHLYQKTAGTASAKSLQSACEALFLAAE